MYCLYVNGVLMERGCLELCSETAQFFRDYGIPDGEIVVVPI